GALARRERVAPGSPVGEAVRGKGGEVETGVAAGQQGREDLAGDRGPGEAAAIEAGGERQAGKRFEAADERQSAGGKPHNPRPHPPALSPWEPREEGGQGGGEPGEDRRRDAFLVVAQPLVLVEPAPAAAEDRSAGHLTTVFLVEVVAKGAWQDR